MKFYVLTLFPDMVMQGVNTSILGNAMERQQIGVEAVNIRDYTLNKHGKTDDYTYGGGAGMLMQAQPVYDAYLAVKKRIDEDKRNRDFKSGLEQENAIVLGTRVIYVTPQGIPFNQKMAKELSKEEDLVFLCGHYEGVDERVLEEIVTDRISIGDYVLTGGELPAMVMIDAISRLVPGVLHNESSADTESFDQDLLEYPQYSRPEIWREKKVPPVLLSGNHAEIEKWRLKQSVEITKRVRPDLYEKWTAAHAEYFDK